MKYSQNVLGMIVSNNIMLTITCQDREVMIRTNDPDFAKKLKRPYAIILYRVQKHQYIRRRMGEH